MTPAQLDAAVALDRTERLQSWVDTHDELHREEKEALVKRLSTIETKVNSISVKFLVLVTIFVVVGESVLRAAFTYFAQHMP